MVLQHHLIAEGLVGILSAFSLPSNLTRLLSASGGASELRCVHGIRALSMCWIVLGHTYVLMDFELLKDPATMQGWFASLEFELINSGWLAVETFFLLRYVSDNNSEKKYFCHT